MLLGHGDGHLYHASALGRSEQLLAQEGVRQRSADRPAAAAAASVSVSASASPPTYLGKLDLGLRHWRRRQLFVIFVRHECSRSG